MKRSTPIFACCFLLLTLSQFTTARIARAQNVDTTLRNRAVDSLIAWHPIDSGMLAQPISYQEFLSRVLEHNLDYTIQKYNISIAQAEIEVAKIYPDPVISAAFSKDITGGLPADSIGGNVLSVGASQTILLGGKISCAVAVASENKIASAATVQDYFWKLRALAAQAYITAAIADSNYLESLRTYQNLANLAQINAQRANAGDIARTDFIQSRVDAVQARGAVLAADAARQTAFLAMGQLMGNQDVLYQPAGYLAVPIRTFTLDTLLSHADSSRSDLIAARDEVESARLGIDLARALRWPDVTLGLGYTRTASTTALPSPFPNENVVGLNISIPIPISAVVNHGTLDAAEFTYEQLRDSLAALKLNVETSVRQSYMQYELALEEYQQYSTDLLRDAETVWAARLYSYKAGNTELLDVLAADNTLASVYQAYYAALSNYANALVTLEASSQVWDIGF